MWIESITVEGIKSFRERNTIELVSGNNVIVGRNGSGKSNLLYALALVLQPHSITQREMPHIISHGKTTATVELVINNEDQRLPINSQHVKVTRNIGSKSDHFFVNGSKMPMKEVIELLEASGMSSNNPYNIVRQGEVRNLATSSSKSRLVIVQAVAGINIYEQNKIHGETKLKHIRLVMEEIRKCISETDIELEEIQKQEADLRKYKDLDMRHKEISLMISRHQYKELSKRIISLQEEVNQSAEKERTLKQEMCKIQIELDENQKNEEEIKKNEYVLGQRRNEVQSEMESDIAKEKRKNFDITDKMSQITELEEQINEDERVNIKEGKLIAHKKDVFEKIEKKHQENQDEISTIKNDLEMQEEHLNHIYAKYNRLTKFKNKKQREQWFANELDNKKRGIEIYSRTVGDLRNQQAVLTAEAQDAEHQILEQNKLVQNMQQEKYALLKAIEVDKKQSLEQELSRKQKFQERLSAHQDLSKARDLIKEMEDSLMRKSGASAKQKIIGMNSIQKVMDHLKSQKLERNVWEGALGIFADFFKCDTALNTAVSAIAGSRLFNYVVTTPHVATRLLHWMKVLNLPGQVDFMPIDKIRPYRNDNNIPQGSCRLIDKLQFQESHSNVIRYVFGSFLLARSNKDFRQITEKNYNGITLDGDQTSNKGVMTGGYYGDGTTNKYALYLKVKDTKKKVPALQTTLSNIENSLTKIETDHQKILEKIQNQQLKHDQKIQKSIDSIVVENRMKNEEIVHKKKSLQNLKSRLTVEETNMAKESQKFNDLEKERDSSGQTQDSQETESLLQKIEGIRKEYKIKFENSRTLQRDRNEQNSRLELLDKQIKDRSEIIEKCKGELDFYKVQLSTWKDEEKTWNAAIQKNKNTLHTIEEKLANVVLSKSDVSKRLSDLTQEKDHTESEITLATNVKEATTVALQQKDAERASTCEQISSLGQVKLGKQPKEMRLKECIKERKKIKLSLDKLSGKVNQAAIHLLQILQKEKDEYEMRFNRKEQDEKEVQSLLEQLQCFKGSILQSSYDQVKENFAEIFPTLAPGGTGNINFQIENIPLSLTSDSGDSVVTEDKHTGINIDVKFKETEKFHEIASLSGGQQTVVSLSLIFAIQRCFEAPIYIFDEVDAALDTNRRKSVAMFINSLSSSNRGRSIITKKPQFIATTFRKELLSSADRYIGVKFHKGVSHADIATREAAYEFITHKAPQEEASSASSSQSN